VIHFFSELLARFGYVIVALFMITEGCGIPVPAYTILVTAAAVASRGTLSIWGVGLAGALGGIVGGSAGYAIGAQGGMRLVRRYGARMGIDDEKLARSRKFFERRGLWAAFLGRFLAFVRIVVPMLAGVSQMPFARFSLANAAGAVASSACYAALGYFFGRDLRKLEHHLTEVTLAVIALLVGWLIVRRTRQRRTAGAA
jgi:membrane protein DedA with SNARE-associated domain